MTKNVVNVNVDLDHFHKVILKNNSFLKIIFCILKYRLKKDDS